MPMGPIMELRVPDSQTAFTQQTAAQAVDYWQTTANQLVNDPETPADSDPRKVYSKMASAQASLLSDHNFTAEAQQAYKAATEICPTSPEAVFGYVNLLMSHNQLAQAVPVVESAVAAAPDNQQFQDLLRNLKGRNP
jgi:predicted Zn-dependent protease